MFSAIRSFFSSPAVTPDQLAAAKSSVESLISSNHVAVFSKSYCPHCTRAKSLLSSLGQPGGVIELNNVPNGDLMQSYLAERAGVSRVTVPQVYVGGKLLGGNSEIQSLHASGRLVPLFK